MQYKGMHLNPLNENLEPIIQSKIYQKKKTKYHILLHIYVIQKNGTDEPICRAGIDMQTQRRDAAREVEGGKNGKSSIETYTLPTYIFITLNIMYTLEKKVYFITFQEVENLQRIAI